MLPPSTAPNRLNGFTLIELSIVLVIIGLLVGGVMVGKDLIKTSEIHAQISQIESFTTAASTFRDKTNYLPADIPPTEATQLGFFTFTGTYAGQTYVDGSNYRYGFGDASGDIQNGERYVFWQHLSEAGLIRGSYGGAVGGVNYLKRDGTTVSGSPINAVTTVQGWDLFLPKSKFSCTDNHISVSNNRWYTDSLRFTQPTLPNFFIFGTTANQEYVIDSKLDDGFPDKGRIRDAGYSAVGGYSSCATAPPRAYDLTPATADKPDTCGIVMLW